MLSVQEITEDSLRNAVKKHAACGGRRLAQSFFFLLCTQMLWCIILQALMYRIHCSHSPSPAASIAAVLIVFYVARALPRLRRSCKARAAQILADGEHHILVVLQMF